jgi:hypothetical protein
LECCSFKIFLTEVGDFAGAYCGDVAAVDQELHDFGAFAGELGPA